MACQKCGNCCSWGVGYVFVSNKKYEKYEKFSDFPLEDLVFVKAVEVEGPCPYLNKKSHLCDIYEDRPLYCRIGHCIKSMLIPSLETRLAFQKAFKIAFLTPQYANVHILRKSV